MATHIFRKLDVWRGSMDLVTGIYQFTRNFPSEEKYALIDQIRRAAISIPLNIAEGCGSGSNPEFVRFLKIAQRSAYELITALELSANLGFATKVETDEFIMKIDELSAMLSGLIKSLAR